MSSSIELYKPPKQEDSVKSVFESMKTPEERNEFYKQIGQVASELFVEKLLEDKNQEQNLDLPEAA